MKTTINFSLFFLAGALTAGSLMPKEGGVCFRFDDNKPVQNWNDMAEVFEKNNARFGMSINPQTWWQKGYPEMLRDMQKRGFEIMDHTPNHALFQHQAADDAELERCKKMTDFHHAQKRRVYFRYERNPDYSGIPLTADLKGNTASNIRMDGKLKKRLNQWNFLYNPETKQAWRFQHKDGILTLNSFWNENNINLPQADNVRLEIVPNSGGFNVPENVLKLHAEISQKRFKEIGIVPPVTYIQPGGSEAVPDAKNIGAVYSTYGYTGGATYPRSAFRSYNEPNPQRQRFAMMWGQFNLEQKDISKVKNQIADTVARHQVAIGSSHMQVRNVPGGWAEYRKRHDELLKWCNAKKIPVRLQKEWCERLYYKKADPAFNIMPSLAADLDENGIPDAYQLYPGVQVSGGILKVPKAGRVFEVIGLNGAERGKNRFELAYRTAGQGVLTAEITAMKGWWTPLKQTTMKIPLKAGDWQTFQGIFDIPSETETLRIDFRAHDLTGPVEIRDLEITADKQK